MAYVKINGYTTRQDKDYHWTLHEGVEPARSNFVMLASDAQKLSDTTQGYIPIVVFQSVTNIPAPTIGAGGGPITPGPQSGEGRTITIRNTILGDVLRPGIGLLDDAGDGFANVEILDMRQALKFGGIPGTAFNMVRKKWATATEIKPGELGIYDPPTLRDFDSNEFPTDAIRTMTDLEIFNALYYPWKLRDVIRYILTRGVPDDMQERLNTNSATGTFYSIDDTLDQDVNNLFLQGTPFECLNALKAMPQVAFSMRVGIDGVIYFENERRITTYDAQLAGQLGRVAPASITEGLVVGGHSGIPIRRGKTPAKVFAVRPTETRWYENSFVPVIKAPYGASQTACDGTLVGNASRHPTRVGNWLYFPWVFPSGAQLYTRSGGNTKAHWLTHGMKVMNESGEIAHVLGATQDDLFLSNGLGKTYTNIYYVGESSLSWEEGDWIPLNTLMANWNYSDVAFLLEALRGFKTLPKGTLQDANGILDYSNIEFLGTMPKRYKAHVYDVYNAKVALLRRYAYKAFRKGATAALADVLPDRPVKVMSRVYRRNESGNDPHWVSPGAWEEVTLPIIVDGNVLLIDAGDDEEAINTYYGLNLTDVSATNTGLERYTDGKYIWAMFTTRGDDRLDLIYEAPPSVPTLESSELYVYPKSVQYLEAGYKVGELGPPRDPVVANLEIITQENDEMSFALYSKYERLESFVVHADFIEPKDIKMPLLVSTTTYSIESGIAYTKINYRKSSQYQNPALNALGQIEMDIARRTQSEPEWLEAP